MLDLTIDDPMRAALPVDERAMLAALSDPSALTTRDDAPARAAIARDWAALGVSIDPARIVLAAGRDSALARAIATLCEPHEEIITLTPRVAAIARLAGVHVAQVPLARAEHGFELDVAAIYDAISDRTRAIVLSAPHEPTGVVLTEDTHEALVALGVPLIVDESRARYVLDAPEDRVSSVLARPLETLAIASSCFEIAPALELAWLGVGGPAHDVEDAVAKLDATAATHGAIASPLLAAVPRLLESASATRDAITARIRRNLDALRARVPDGARIEGGWLACLRYRNENAGAHARPGVLYDLSSDWVVVSLLTEPATFDAGLDELLA
ncbi:pyridoxal phosphate-dependent aminotransferase [Sandaracinus amylolyticus]|uniref:Glutamine-dependent 2-keto-4-methylthiobutyrate transaminase n=1 Tax=Sandaracinus amylolyticus TaxID=927083 RepID=A0A0F6W118_9BACT|nr:pyridoxal phosphate-dependent aminotransferase [Sandaracinus amylolyticus]AKF04533.1 Glutamine-dependent 2-keto-4-methylthiobutyrate transaminase [Sandaracinus amylolyticus]